MHILNVFECQTIKTSKTLKNLLRTNNEVLFFSSFCFNKVCIGDKFSKSFQSYLGEDADYNFVNNMIKESKLCTDIYCENEKKKNL